LVSNKLLTLVLCDAVSHYLTTFYSYPQVSAASAQIEATIGEHYPVRNADGSLKLDSTGATVPDYGLTQAIFMGCVFAGVIITSMYNGTESHREIGYY
jgi:SHS family lactate transporter-like MFS transporter